MPFASTVPVDQAHTAIPAPTKPLDRSRASATAVAEPYDPAEPVEPDDPDAPDEPAGERPEGAPADADGVVVTRRRYRDTEAERSPPRHRRTVARGDAAGAAGLTSRR